MSEKYKAVEIASLSACTKGVIFVCKDCGRTLIQGKKFIQGITEGANGTVCFTAGAKQGIHCCGEEKITPILIEECPVPSGNTEQRWRYDKKVYALPGLDADAIGPLKVEG